MANRNETPKTSKPQRSVGENKNKNKTPSLSGTSAKAIGKPLSPIKPRPKIVSKMPEKAIWVGRLHRDTTEDEILAYTKDDLRIADVDQLQVRKLVKKDRNISEYSFISFKIACSNEMLKELLDINKWPSYCKIGEFSTDVGQPEIARLKGKSPSKNELQLNEIQTPNPDQTQQIDMETID